MARVLAKPQRDFSETADASGGEEDQPSGLIGGQGSPQPTDGRFCRFGALKVSETAIALRQMPNTAKDHDGPKNGSLSGWRGSLVSPAVPLTEPSGDSQDGACVLSRELNEPVTEQTLDSRVGRPDVAHHCYRSEPIE